MTLQSFLPTIGIALANMLLVLLVAPLLEGTIRKLRAAIQSRQGPPIYQPYLDLLKLLAKEDLRVTDSPIVSWGPPVMLATILVAAALMPLGLVAPTLSAGDLIVFIGLLALANLTLAGMGFATGSAFSSLGASREVMSMLAAEPVMFVSLLVLAVESGSMTFGGLLTAPIGVVTVVAGLTYLLALQMYVAKVPFDTTEAETELIGGPLSELSGPKLALAQWAIYAKQFIYSSLFIQLFLPWTLSFIPWLPLAIVVNVLLVLVLDAAVVGLVMSVNPRLRLDQALRYGMSLAGVASIVLIVAAIL
ncbi:MAG: respiratory chain complex I subunit 1 family protein [Armatimonadota bacterium]